MPAGWRHVKERDDYWGDKKLKRKSASQNIILIPLDVPCGRKKRFLVDGIVRGKPSTPDVIVALLKARKARKTQHDFSAIDKKTMMPAGQNRQGRQVILHIILTLFKVLHN